MDDANGLDDVEYSYRWIRVDGSDETRIGTDSRTYTVVGADIGKRIKVRVSFVDYVGFAEAVESAPVQTDQECVCAVVALRPAVAELALVLKRRITLKISAGQIVEKDIKPRIEQPRPTLVQK